SGRNSERDARLQRATLPPPYSLFPPLGRKRKYRKKTRPRRPSFFPKKGSPPMAARAVMPIGGKAFMLFGMKVVISSGRSIRVQVSPLSVERNMDSSLAPAISVSPIAAKDVMRPIYVAPPISPKFMLFQLCP